MRIRRTALLALIALSASIAVRAEPVTRREVLAAIAVLEDDVTSADAIAAAATIARFGQESDEVLITVGADTLPWVQADVPEAQAKVRALLMAAYFAGDIKSQLEKRRSVDDPYRGWLSVIRAYRQILKKQPDMVIPEVEELVRKEKTGTLKHEADELRQQQEREQQRERRPTNMVWENGPSRFPRDVAADPEAADPEQARAAVGPKLPGRTPCTTPLGGTAIPS